MKVVYPISCGVDVHKTFLVGTIISTTDGVQPHYQKKRFSTYNSDLHRFADWLHANNCTDVCMESTGKYWVPVFNILEERGIRVTIANPKWVKAVKGNKDDTKDSKWIGDLFRLGLVPGSFIPSKKIRILREFTRYRYKLVSMKSSEKNRFQNAFTVCNVALDSVVSDMFGKSATAITDYLISEGSFNPEYCVSLLQRSLKKKSDSVLESIEGYSITDEQKLRTLGNAEHGGKFFHRVLLFRIKLLTESGSHRIVSEPVHKYMTGFMCKNKPPFPNVLLLPQVLINNDKSFGRYNRYSLTLPPK